MKRVIVAGTRTFNYYGMLELRLLEFLKGYDLKDVEIISGGASGADSLGEKFARLHGCKLTIIEADWNQFGRKAGIIRNAQMAKYAAEIPESICICFWDGASNGTKNMMEQAEKFGLVLYVNLY